MLAVETMHGLGDSLYQRPIVKALAEEYDPLFVTTPWPQFFADIPGVSLVKPSATYRTQRRNLDRVASRTDWRTARGVRQVRFGYMPGDLRKRTLFETLCVKVGVERQAFDWAPPPLPPCPVPTDRPFAVIRPVTERYEWLNRARNPDPQYVAEAAEELRARGFVVVSIADIASRMEWLVGPKPYADIRFHKGELGAMELLSLVAHAAVVVGPVGWIVPACVTLGTPLVVIGGGQGGHNAPERLVDRHMPLSPICWIRPKPACDCASMEHACNKVIPHFREQFRTALDLLPRAS